MQKHFKKNIVLLWVTFVCVYALNAQTWEKIEMNFPPSDTLLQISRIAFATKNVGWIITTGQSDVHDPLSNYLIKIFKTVDGGHNWTLQKSIDSTFGASSIFTTDSLHCWAFGDDLLFTSDGGVTWNAYRFPKNDVYTTYFFNNNEGIGLSYTRPWFTTDGGLSWSAGDSSLIMLRAQNDFIFTDRNRGWFVSDSSPLIRERGSIAGTIDGGKTWTYQDSAAAIMFGGDFVDTLNGFAVGTDNGFGTGYIYHTTDGGNHWVYTKDFDSGVMFDVGFYNSKIGWITGRWGRIWGTTDAGTNWILQNVNVNTTLGKVIVLKKEKTVYIWGGGIYDRWVGEWTRPKLFYADLSSITDIKKEEQNNPEEYSLTQNYPNPFNPTTTIHYQLLQSGKVTLKLFDILGNEVKTLVNEQKEKGNYSVQFSGGDGLASGMYVYRLRVNDYVSAKKMLLIK